ncbi:MAG TPA: AsmA family protein, partial [Candidatus Ozemobacteraceae bacterium]|nr:AsmA family protein [Candidatus Ozemobacteraceae bacterium]
MDTIPTALPDPIDHEPEEKPRSMRARLIGIGLGAIGLFVLLALGAVYYAYTTYLDPVALKRQLEEKAGQALGMPVTVAEISLKWPTITMKGLRVGDPASGSLPFVEIGMAAATPDFFELLTGNVMLESVFVSSASARLTRGVDGAFILSARPATAGSVSKSGTDAGFDVRGLPLRVIEIEQVRFSIDDLVSKKTFNGSVP